MTEIRSEDDGEAQKSSTLRGTIFGLGGRSVAVAVADGRLAHDFFAEFVGQRADRAPSAAMRRDYVNRHLRKFRATAGRRGRGIDLLNLERASTKPRLCSAVARRLGRHDL